MLKKIEHRILSLIGERSLSDADLDELFYGTIKKKLTTTTSKLGPAQWSNSFYQTDYSTLLNILNLVPSNKTIVDVGSSFGRMGLLNQLSYRSVRYIGYEICPYKIEIANKALKKLTSKGSCKSKFIKQDLSDETIPIAKAVAYYMYDPVNLASLKVIIKNIKKVNTTPVILYFKFGASDTANYIHSNFKCVLKVGCVSAFIITPEVKLCT